MRVPSPLQAIIGGEALFNDGIGIVLYTIYLHQATRVAGSGAVVPGVLLDFMGEAGGGVLLGLAGGGLAFTAMRGIDSESRRHSTSRVRLRWWSPD